MSIPNSASNCCSYLIKASSLQFVDSPVETKPITKTTTIIIIIIGTEVRIDTITVGTDVTKVIRPVSNDLIKLPTVLMLFTICFLYLIALIESFIPFPNVAVALSSFDDISFISFLD